MIKYLDLAYQNKKIKAQAFREIKRVVKNNEFILGDSLSYFEEEFAKYMEVNFVRGISNGTDALEIALRSLQLPPNAEVIVPTNSFIASAIAVKKAGLKLVLCDVDFNSSLISAKEIQTKITKNTKVIMPVHLYGQCAPMNEIQEVARSKDLFVVEDIAQAQGATHFGKKAGSWGDISATSFYPGKNLGAWGDAGAILTNDFELYKIASMLRNYGSDVKYKHDIYGFNYRMDDLQSVVLKVKLKYLDEWNKKRISLAERYRNNLSGIYSIQIPEVLEGNVHVYHIFPILCRERDLLQKKLWEDDIETVVHYPIPIHKQKYMQNEYIQSLYPNADKLASSVLSIPLYPGLSKKDIDHISEKIIKNCKKF